MIDKKITCTPTGWSIPSGGGDRLQGPGITPVMPDREAIKAFIAQKYRTAATSPEGLFQYPVGRSGAAQLGYDMNLLSSAPTSLVQGFCGVGNPFSLGLIQKGEKVLDIGCGGGLDLFVAAHLTGEGGWVIGVDPTLEMLDRARKMLDKSGLKNWELLQLDSDTLPLGDAQVDKVISNGVFNLVPDKHRLFLEVFRVLRPGGQLQFADIILHSALPPELAANADAWSQWIGGAIPGGDQISMLETAGFIEVQMHGTTPMKTSQYTTGAQFSARKPREK